MKSRTAPQRLGMNRIFWDPNLFIYLYLLGG
jgi:hypothetical protein